MCFFPNVFPLDNCLMVLWYIFEYINFFADDLRSLLPFFAIFIDCVAVLIDFLAVLELLAVGAFEGRFQLEGGDDFDVFFCNSTIDI